MKKSSGINRHAVFVLILAGLFLTAFKVSADEARSAPVLEKLGIEGGYFVCESPEGWSRMDNDPDYGDERTYLIVFNGSSYEGVEMSIYISFYGDGNEDFDGHEDFVYRNTTDIFGEVTAVPEKVEIKGKSALTFGYERKQYLHINSTNDEWMMIRKKFYVLLAKDGKGFFVLEYYAPSSVYEEGLPVFQRVVDSFEMV